MNRILLLIALYLNLSILINNVSAQTPIQTPVPTQEKPKGLATRDQISSVINSPVEYKGKLYFLATTGHLYQSDLKIEKIDDLFHTDKNSMSGVIIYKNLAIFGEGLHADKKTNLYAFNLDTKKIEYKVSIDGHIERYPLLTNNNQLLIGAGDAGIINIDPSTGKTIWATNKGKLHCDHTPVIYKDLVCASSIYSTKGIVCLNIKDGTENFIIKLSKDPKTEYQLHENKIFGMTTTANLQDAKWETPSNFYIIDLDKKKKIAETELRGFSFFGPYPIENDYAIISLSTGDILAMSLINGEIKYIGEFPEPFINTPIHLKDQSRNQYCFIGILGKILCFQYSGNNIYKIVRDDRIFETVIGRIGPIANNIIYLPTRRGYYLL